MPISSRIHDQEELRERIRHLQTPEQQEQRRRYHLAFGLGLIWAVLMLGAEFSGVLNDFAQPLLDWQMTLATAPRPADKDLALLAIDRIPSDRPWPWTRFDYALVLHTLLPFAAQSMVIEVLLNDRDTQYTVFDDQFGNVVNRYDEVIFSGAVLRVDNSEPKPKNLTVLPVTGRVRELPLFQGLLWPLETFSGQSVVGVRNLLPEADGQVRRLPLVFRFKEQLLPSLALQALGQRLKADWSKSLVLLGEAVELRDGQGKRLRRVPIDGEGMLTLRYRTLRAQPWTMSFDDVLMQAQQLERGEVVKKDLRQLRGRQVWIGRTDRVDFEPVPTAVGRMTPVEVQMMAVRQMLDEDYVQPWPPIAVVALFVVTAVVGAWVTVRWGPLWATVGLVLTGLGVLMLGAWFFRMNNANGPLLTYDLLLFGTWVAGLAAKRWDMTDKVEADKDQLPLKL